MTSSARRRADIPLILILLLSAFLNGYNIWTDAYANTYYTTAVASMLRSFRNFFFAALDPGGFVTIDKPPVTFWVQTVSAYVFGLHGWSVILPQALAGVGSVLLLYRLVKPTFGLAAARIAALAMACTPIAVAVSRTNNIDSMLVFTLLLATCLLFRGIKKNSIRSLLGAFAMIGVAFNMKMLQAYMVLPAFYLFYIVAAKWNRKKKIGLLAGATAIMLVISLSWAVIVDSIPADQRPYIGSSQNNSVLGLALGYNGISRLTGNGGPGGGGGMPNRDDGGFAPDRGNGFSNDGGFAPDQGNGSANTDGRGANRPNGGGSIANRDGNGARFEDSGAMRNFDGAMPNFGGGQGQPPGPGGDGRPGDRGGFGGGMFGTGEKGPLRLFQSALSGQASWLIPFAAFACVGLFAGWRRRHFTQRHKEALFWLAWLVPGMIFFSIAGFFHPYYLIMLAPPIAALVGAGWAKLWDLYRRHAGWLSWLLPAAILATSAFECYIIHPYDATIGSGWSIGIAGAGIMVTPLLLVLKQRERMLARTVALVGLLALFVGPLYWAATPITYGQNSMLPQAGPGVARDRGGMVPGMNAAMGFDRNDDGRPGTGGGMEGRPRLDEAALTYLKEHNTGETYLFATTDYNTAAPYIIDAGQSVIILGGFSGADPVFTVEKLEQLVAKGELKYFMIGGGMGGGRGGNSELTKWIIEHGTEIPAEQWRSAGGNMTLYEVK